MPAVIFPSRLYAGLTSFLFSTSPRENGCFLLASSYQTKSGDQVLIINEIVKPASDSWNREGEHSLEPSSSFTNHAVVLGDWTNASVLFVHTHPGTFHPPHFSSIDEKSNGRLFRNLAEILPDRPLGSLVFSKKGVHGVIFDGKNIREIPRFRVVGHTIVDLSGEEKSKLDDSFDRQIRLIGKDLQAHLQDLTVAVIGVGGTGSSVAVQLARMGVGKLILFDRDMIDATNLPRVYGSTKKDIGKPKVAVLKKHIASFSKTRVYAIPTDVTKDDIASTLKETDVIFGCTDNLTSRAMLNDVSLQYYIPLIDVGCRVLLKADGSIDQAICKVQVVTPDDACLWCTGTLDGKIILQEALPDEEKRKQAEEGYYQDAAKQPSVISLTTMAASLGVNKFLSLLGAYGSEYSSRSQIELRNGFMVEDSPSIKENCVCQERRGLGDKRRIANESERVTSEENPQGVQSSSVG